MKVELRFVKGLRVIRESEVGDIGVFSAKAHLSGQPRIGELISCKMPHWHKPETVEGRVLDVGHHTRTGFFRWFSRPSVIVMLGAEG